jgi:hypothetical protein
MLPPILKYQLRRQKRSLEYCRKNKISIMILIIVLKARQVNPRLNLK